MLDLATFEGAQAWLVEQGAVLSGSQARGDARPDSDWDYFGNSYLVKRLVKALHAQGLYSESVGPGCITWYPEGVMVEVSFLFPKRPPFKHGATRPAS